MSNWYEPRETEHYSECRCECEFAPASEFDSEDCANGHTDHECTCADISEARADAEAEAIIEMMD
jgi:hypothetical protein